VKQARLTRSPPGNPKGRHRVSYSLGQCQRVDADVAKRIFNHALKRAYSPKMICIG